jgi:hypothetical protein
MLTKLKIILRDLRIAFLARINYILLGIFPFADPIVSAIAANLPAASVYLPANVYKWVGLAVVLFNIARDMVKQWKAAPGPGEPK